MSILQEADSLINGSRKEEYGSAGDEYARLANSVNANFAEKIKVPFTAEDMLWFMVLLKVNRAIHNPESRDSRVDCAGYIGLVDQVVSGK